MKTLSAHEIDARYYRTSETLDNSIQYTLYSNTIHSYLLFLLSPSSSASDSLFQASDNFSSDLCANKNGSSVNDFSHTRSANLMKVPDVISFLNSSNASFDGFRSLSIFSKIAGVGGGSGIRRVELLQEYVY